MFKRILIAMLGLAMLTAGCGAGAGGGGGGGGGGTPTGDVSTLAGSWYGTIEDYSNYLGTVSAVVSSSGSFTVHNGITGANDSGTISPVAGYSNIFNTSLDSGFIVDPTGTRLGFLDSDANFGVMQKGATSLPSFGGFDIVGHWTGNGVLVTSSYDLEKVFSVDVTVLTGSYPTFSGIDDNGGPVTGTFQSWNSAFGRYSGTATQGGYSSWVHAFLTADKQYFGYEGCQNGGSFPQDCSFGFGRRQ